MASQCHLSLPTRCHLRNPLRNLWHLHSHRPASHRNLPQSLNKSLSRQNLNRLSQNARSRSLSRFRKLLQQSLRRPAHRLQSHKSSLKAERQKERKNLSPVERSHLLSSHSARRKSQYRALSQ